DRNGIGERVVAGRDRRAGTGRVSEGCPATESAEVAGPARALGPAPATGRPGGPFLARELEPASGPGRAPWDRVAALCPPAGDRWAALGRPGVAWWRGSPRRPR